MNGRRVEAVATAVANLGYDGIVAFDQTEPEYDTLETLFETFDDPILVELLVVSATTEDYQLNGDAQLFWNELERVALAHGSLDSKGDVQEILDTFMTADVNARLNQTKRDRLERLFGNGFDDWFIANAETAKPVEVWEQLADCLQNDKGMKTVVLSMKVYDIARLIRLGHYLDFPSDLPIPCDLQVKRISRTSGITYSDETDRVLDAWAAVMDEVSDRLGRPVSVLRVDSIVWQAGQIVGKHEPDRVAAREALEGHFETVGIEPDSASELARELTTEM